MAYSKNSSSMIDEMAIVDTFTKLIFDADSTLDETETILIKLLGQVEPALLGASARDVSEYLRSMGVDEMITVVGQIKRYYDQQQSLIAAGKPLYQHRLHR